VKHFVKQAKSLLFGPTFDCALRLGGGQLFRWEFPA
jgi:hypothetical protein